MDQEPIEIVRFDKQVAVVTGAGGSLGRTYAIDLAKRGAKVVVNDYGGDKDGTGERSSGPARAVVDEIKALGGEAIADGNDVSTPEGGERIIQSALDRYGTVDILINNAGIVRDKNIVDLTPENWNAVIDVHLNGAYNVTRPAFAVMKAKGFGRIVFTTSASGLYGNFGQTNYAAAKLGLIGFMNTLKLEGAKYDVRVNAVAPIAASRMTEGVMPPELLKISAPELVSPLVIYLCSKSCKASGNVYNAGMGRYNRVALVTGEGWGIDDIRKVPRPEDIARERKRIDSLENGKEYSLLLEFFGDIVSRSRGNN